MFMELKAGNLDRMGLNAIQYSRQTEYPKFQRMYQKYRYMPFSYIYLGYNLNDSRFADRRVRQALTHAINKKEIIDGVLMGLGEEATGPYKPGTWYYNPNVPKFPYDPAKAKALLAAAGWTAQCRRGSHQGRPPLCVHHPHQPGQRYPATHRRDHPEPAPGRGHPGEDPAGGVGRVSQRIHRKGAVRGDPVGLEHRPGPGPVRHLEFHQDQARRTQRHRLQKPRGGRAAGEGRHTFDREKRRQAYFRFQEIVAEDQPYTFLFVPDALPAISRRFRGIKPAPAGIDYNFIKWYVPQGEQKYTMSPY